MDVDKVQNNGNNSRQVIDLKWEQFSPSAGLDIGYVPAGPRAFFRLSGQFGPQQFIFCWPAGPVTFILVVNTFTTFSVDLSRARGFLIRNLPSPS